MLRPLLAIVALGLSSPLLAQQSAGPDVEAPGAADYRADAEALHGMIALYYAYRDRFPGNAIPRNPMLEREAAAVADRRALLRYAERALLLLRDHHAITGSSFADSWALVPSYSDLWIEYEDGRYRIDAVREGSPAAEAGVVAGMELTAITGEPVDAAVAAFWADLGESAATDGLSQSFAARVLAAGRRDRPRDLTLKTTRGEMRVQLLSLYAIPQADRSPVDLTMNGDTASIRFNDSLGDDATIAAFDEAMTEAIAGGASTLVLDLTDTPSGGNTSVARGVMGWFAAAPAPYQIHVLPVEERRSGIARRWAEYVLPRDGKHFAGPVTVRVGRWTGSMGEGLGIGMQALGATLVGDRMAGLLGAIYDLRLEHSGLVFKLPVERLYSVDGTPREDAVPQTLR